MISRSHVRASDLRGLARLATAAARSVTGIAEGVHHSVYHTLGVQRRNAAGRTDGLTGLVYRGIHVITGLVGTGVEHTLAGLEMALGSAVEDAAPGSHPREAVLAALNGVMGDRLAADDSPLAIRMHLRRRGAALNTGQMPPAADVTGKVLLLVHGLCMNDLQWRREREGTVVDHGEALASALGYTPVSLLYNSGLHTSQNGRELSAQLESLIAHWPVPVDDLTVVAHSMGGLLIRSAHHCASRDARNWPGVLRHIVFLGTPHHGAPLERAGHHFHNILDTTPFTAPFSALGRLRSAGITDLRYGHVVDEDWSGHNRFHRRSDTRQMVPLPEGVRCFAIGATRAAKRSPIADRLIGDGLVPLHSALGLHDDAERCLAFDPSAQWIAYRTSHIELLHNPAVARQMIHWLTPPA